MTTPQKHFTDACEKGDLAVVENFIRCHGKEINIHDSDELALRLGAIKGHLDIVKYLAEEHQADIHATNECALRWAAEQGHFSIVKYLIEEHQADIHANDEYALQMSAVNKHLDIVVYLAEQGTKYDVLKNNSATVGVYDQIKTHMDGKQQQQQQALNSGIIKKIPARRAVRRRPLTP